MTGAQRLGDLLTPQQIVDLYLNPKNGFGSLQAKVRIDALLDSLQRTGIAIKELRELAPQSRHDVLDLKEIAAQTGQLALAALSEHFKSHQEAFGKALEALGIDPESVEQGSFAGGNEDSPIFIPGDVALEKHFETEALKALRGERGRSRP